MRIVIDTPYGLDGWELSGFTRDEIPKLVRSEFGNFSYRVVD